MIGAKYLLLLHPPRPLLERKIPTRDTGLRFSVPRADDRDGYISGLRSGGNPEMDLRLRPQTNGFLHGELVIHQSGFGMTPIDGYVRGNHLQFQVPYGNETYYFEGARRSDET